MTRSSMLLVLFLAACGGASPDTSDGSVSLSLQGVQSAPELRSLRIASIEVRADGKAVPVQLVDGAIDLAGDRATRIGGFTLPGEAKDVRIDLRFERQAQLVRYGSAQDVDVAESAQVELPGATLQNAAEGAVLVFDATRVVHLPNGRTHVLPDLKARVVQVQR